MLATNKGSSAATATISNSTIHATGAVNLVADDSGSIWANVKLVSSSVTTNTGGLNVLQNEISVFVPADYISTDGNQTLNFGDAVRLADGFGDPVATTTDAVHQLVSVATGDTIALHDAFGASHLTTASGIRLLKAGDIVTVDEGYLGGGL